MERGKHVAQTIADKARESADDHGLAGNMTAGQLVDAALSGELADSAKEVAGDVLRTSDEALRTQIGASGPVRQTWSEAKGGIENGSGNQTGDKR